MLLTLGLLVCAQDVWPLTDWLVDPTPFEARVEHVRGGSALLLTNGLVRREVALEPNGATVALDVRSGVGSRSWSAVLRAVEPEARVTLDGVELDVGGLVGQANRAFLPPLEELAPDPDALRLVGHEVGEPVAPFEWKRVRHHAPAAWPPAGVALRLDFAPPESRAELAGLTVAVHYELYDGLPCVAKWIEVHNGTQRPLVVDRFRSELLAVVEGESLVESRAGVAQRLPNLWVETDYACGGADANGQRFAVHWRTDPAFTSQVNYRLQTPCLLECGPSVGPAQTVEPGATFTSFRTFVLLHDSEDRARNGLARCRMFRTIAPWATENPLMMHVTSSDPEVVRRAVDQCAEVGFEMVILSFGSGFDIESADPAYRATMKGLAAYAEERGVELGGYSLLSSRRIGDGQDVVPPPGESPAHGSCPALTSAWGQAYYENLYEFFADSGFTMLEHDGPYPGDFDVTPRPPLQKGYEDSQWAQFRIAADFYRWCRARGVFLNTPDWYFLNGSTKAAMGYREVNWSLPRADQVLHTRQNVFDGTWTKTPTMGWMFVPLTQYHGGGAAATVEPLSEHLDHYRRMFEGNLGAGVQACYRGQRLFDTDATREMVAAQVAWFKEHRHLLEADIDHAASRRADGRDLDWLLHVRPEGARLGGRQGLLVVHNPLDRDLQRTLTIDLTYTGVTGAVRVGGDGGGTLELDGRGRVALPVDVPAGEMRWYTFAQPE